MTASTFRMFIDKGIAHESATKDQVVVGAKFKYGNIEYTTTAVDGDRVMMQYTNGAKTRTTFVSIGQITKSGSDYRLIC